ncbi:DUF397 domain-containing protein [Saccharopolyspora gregorii]|uniref:DUF397 domain-containing protein n=1 Tax=Saccharopolyspora gregorii TaxID=33914 RepID=UPI0031ECF6D3
MSEFHADRAKWRKSSRSISAANCVEVALASGSVGVRDSKSPETGVLVVPARRWADFLAAVGDSRLR